ncbi:GNAT family N-acetyltransferase [Planobacterium oryzisoli]|uniref:N-acetyltransferase n=1 Tax=Planobacterium oryzisoli TaxID=2771435 RepID=A0A931E8S4_9FLAO|nr:GNAT family N-acetyltransferase [Planobacterium oryzisoli]MBF5027082.1 N-acetyltransferase [Planobacterium oryzisoli]
MKEISHKQNENSGAFHLLLEGEKIGEITYRKDQEGVAIIDHTEVDSSHSGNGYAKELVEAASNFAKSQGLKVRALCPYAAKTMARHEQWKDLLVE